MPHTIIVIDDHQLTLDVVKDILLEESYDVYVFPSLSNENIFFHLQPDLLILDVALRNADGRDLCRAIRKTFPDLPILIFSAYLDSAASAFEAGATDFLKKPFNISALLAIVKKNIHTPAVC